MIWIAQEMSQDIVNIQTTGLDADLHYPHSTGMKRLPQFDLKLRLEIVPTWDGNVDTLSHWITKVHQLSKESSLIERHLGSIVPHQLA